MMQSAHAVAVESFLVDEALAPTLAALYQQRVALTPDAIACRDYDAVAEIWVDTRWSALQARAARYAAGFARSGLRAGDRIGIQIPNGVDWLAIDYAAQQLGLVVVGLHSEDTAAASAWILADADVKCLFLRDADAWMRLTQDHHLPELLLAVLMRGDDAQDRRAQSLAEWLPPSAAALPACRAQPDALATIAYTSGSTGRPKGVMLSQANVVANVFACLRALGAADDELLLSILPLAQMFERTAGAYLAVAAGACTVYCRGPAQLAQDLKSHKPTMLLAAPRVYERIHAAFAARVENAPPAQRALLRLSLGRRSPPSALSRRAGQFVRMGLGGRLRLAVCGGAPLAEEISRLFIACGVPLLQGYGLTEAGPVVSVNRLNDNDPASVGRPLDNVEIRIGTDGELLLRSPSVMMGYWRDVDATRAAIDSEGWLHSGDKASRLDTSHLYLTGRLKDLIVTATGEKAAPADIEQCLLAEPLFDQVMVVGEARPYLTALLVPESGRLALLRAALGLNDGDDTAPARDAIEQALLQRCRKLLADRPRTQQLVRVALVMTPWTTGAGLLTSSQKLKRLAIARHHADDIERLYAGHYRAPKTDCSRNAEI